MKFLNTIRKIVENTLGIALLIFCFLMLLPYLFKIILLPLLEFYIRYWREIFK